MNIEHIDDAAAAHIDWKLRLIRLLDGSSQDRLDSAEVRRDDLCELGQWIYGEGSTYKTMGAYQDLLKEHARFHICAAEVVVKMESGDRAGANAVLNGPFAAASRHIVDAVMRLKEEVGKR